MPDTGGDWWQKIGGAAGLAALAGVILDKFRTWKTADTDAAIKIDEVWDKQAKELYDRQQSYIEKLEKRVGECEADIDLQRLKARQVEAAAGFVSRENNDLHDLVHRVRVYYERESSLPAHILAELSKYDDR